MLNNAPQQITRSWRLVLFHSHAYHQLKMNVGHIHFAPQHCSELSGPMGADHQITKFCDCELISKEGIQISYTDGGVVISTDTRQLCRPGAGGPLQLQSREMIRQ